MIPLIVQLMVDCMSGTKQCNMLQPLVHRVFVRKDGTYRLMRNLTTLENYVGSNNADVLKEIGQGTGTNTSGFSVMIAGVRYTSAGFDGLGMMTFLYSSIGSPTTCRYMYLFANDPLIHYEVNYPTNAMSVRCLKN